MRRQGMKIPEPLCGARALVVRSPRACGDAQPSGCSIGTIATAELIGGMEKRGMKVVASAPARPQRFARERMLIVAAFDVEAVCVDDVGSTSVPGAHAEFERVSGRAST